MSEELQDIFIALLMAAKKTNTWMDGAFSDSDYDMDSSLSDANAALFLAIYDAEKYLKAIPYVD